MYSLLHHNTFGIDAKCREFLEYQSIEELQTLLPRVRAGRWLQIGGGSNLLFTCDFDGVILHSRIATIEELERTQQDVLLRVGAGVVWDEFVAYCVERGFYGLENLSLIPGEVGASAVQNIGAYGAEVCQHIERVETVEAKTGKVSQFSCDACKYAYRSSIFKHALRGHHIVTHVVFRLPRHFSPNLSYAALRREVEASGLDADCLTAEQLRTLIIQIRRAKLPDPAEIGSAGSFFMNPIVPAETVERLLKQYPTMPHYEAPNGGVKLSAGWMIDQCGWKGKSLGRAGVYTKQALVLVNLGGATGAEIVALSNAVRADVKQKFGVGIQPEANFIS